MKGSNENKEKEEGTTALLFLVSFSRRKEARYYEDRRIRVEFVGEGLE